MRLFYALFLLLITAPFLHSQSIEVVPAQGNPALRSYSNQQEVQQAAIVEQMTGVNPLTFQQDGSRDMGVCPPEFLGDIVTSGDSIVIEVVIIGDTATLTLLNLQPLQFGTVTLTGIKLIYQANNGLTDSGIDKVYVESSKASGKDTIEVVIQVKRKGKTVIANAKTVNPETVSSYCLDNELDFPAPMACSEFLLSTSAYDGRGQQLFHFTTYQTADPCMVYYASRFPGTDTVNVRICDALQVCDTFKIPFIVKGDTLKTLPFFDDFSSYRGPYASDKFWLDKHVYVNTTLAKDPPSVGFATFDGLDRRGDLYNVISGVGDRLTSKPIDLSGLSPASNVTLRFFLAPKGHGLEPEIADSIIVEFRNNQRKWVRIATFPGMNDVPIDSFPPFTFHSYKIDEAQYFHKAFQVRFTAHVSPGGSGDLWHLDYVRLAKDEGLTNNFPDVAFTRVPASVLKNYTAMPWWHFEGFEEGELQDKLNAHFYNHFDFVTALGSSRVSLSETTTGTNFNQNFTVVETGGDNNMPVKTPTLRERTIPAGNFSGIQQSLKNIAFDQFRNLQTEYSFTLSAQPSEYLVNDTVRLNNPFSRYFAHDDGTAEWQVYVKNANGNGQQIASRFHANVADTMRAVEFMFPLVNGDVQNQLFNLRVWTGDPATTNPVFERELLKPYYSNNKLDTLQGFTTYRLEDFPGNETPVFIPAGDFYVGWQQVTPGQLGIPVGLDIQNACGCNFSNISGQWKPFTGIAARGSLMIRPVFGSTAPENTSSAATEVIKKASEVVMIFPNPTNGQLNFSLKKGSYSDYTVAVFNRLGQMVTQAGMASEMVLEGVSDGIYFLHIQNVRTGELFNQRIVVAKRP